MAVPYRESSLAHVNCSACITVSPVSICPRAEGSRADDIAQAAEQLNQRWAGFCVLLAERLAWLAYQTKVMDYVVHFIIPFVALS